MRKKMNILLFLNSLFYILIFLNIVVTKKYGVDYILQAITYISLSFSTIVLEEVLKKDVKKAKVKASIDLGIRIAVVAIYFISFMFNQTIIFTVIITLICLLINSIIEIKLKSEINDIKVESEQIVEQKEINCFIQEYYNNKLDNSKFDSVKFKELKRVMNNIKTSGIQNMVAGVLCITLFVLRVALNYSINIFYVILLITSFFIYFFINLNCKLIDSIYENNDCKIRKKVFVNLTFVIGYTILFLCEVIFINEIEVFRVTLWMLSIINFIPILKIKFNEREKLSRIYIEYKKIAR